MSPAETAEIPDALAGLELVAPGNQPVVPEGQPEGEVAGAVDEGQLLAQGAARTPLPEGAVEERRARSGPLQLGLDVSAGYDDNIFLSPTEKVEDYIYAITPRIRIGLGDAEERQASHLLINYDPTALFFQNSPEENAFDQDVSATVAFRTGRSGVTASGRFQTLSGSVQDLGDRADRSVASASIGFSYGWGRKVSVDTTLAYDRTDFEDFLDTTTYSAELAVNYQATPKTAVGLGVRAGRTETTGGISDQDFTEVFLSATTDPTAKLAFRARAGVDFRQTPAEDRATPVFSLGATYRPGERTEFRLDGQRDIQISSADEGTGFTRTGITLGLEQRVGQRWIFGLDVGYEELAFEPVAAGVDADRTDDLYFIRPSARYAFRENLSGSIFYSFRENSSTDGDLSFTSNQAGIELGYDF